VDAPFSNVVPGLMYKAGMVIQTHSEDEDCEEYAPVSCFQFHRSIFKVKLFWIDLSKPE
jgi:hypothetical protein